MTNYSNNCLVTKLWRKKQPHLANGARSKVQGQTKYINTLRRIQSDVSQLPHSTTPSPAVLVINRHRLRPSCPDLFPEYIVFVHT